MKKILSLAIFGSSLLVASTGAFASQCGMSYSNYHRPVPTRAAVVHYQRQNHHVVNYRNQCVRVDGRVTRAERNCLSNRHYRPTQYQHHQHRRSQSGGYNRH